MKKDIHPKYYPKAKVVCGCGASFEVGSTVPEIHVEICSACHPYYTGKYKLLDTQKRVDRFREKLSKVKELKADRQIRRLVDKKAAKPNDKTKTKK